MMMRFLAIGLLFCAGMLAPATASAQAQAVRVDQAALEKLKKYASSDAHYDQIKRIVRLVESNQCARIEINSPAKARFLIRPPEFAGNATTPTGGEWQERWEINRCGDKVLHNFHFIARPNEVPYVNPLPPGNSVAWPREQVQTFNLIAKLMIDRFKQCKNFKLVRTELGQIRQERTFVSNDGKLKADWDEVWHYNVCGEKKDVKITFSTDANGVLGPRFDLPK